MRFLLATVALLKIVNACDEGMRSLVYTDTKCQDIDWKTSKVLNDKVQEEINTAEELSQIRCTDEKVNFFNEESELV